MTSSLPNFLALAPASAGAAGLDGTATATLRSPDGSAPVGDFALLIASPVDGPNARTAAQPCPVCPAPTIGASLSTSLAFAAETLPSLTPADAPVDRTVMPDEESGLVLSRDTMEQAATFFAAILQVVMPATPPPVVAIAPDGAATPSGFDGGMGAPTDASGARVSLAAATGTETDATPVPLPVPGALAENTSLAADSVAAPACLEIPFSVGDRPCVAVATSASDGAVELSLVEATESYAGVDGAAANEEPVTLTVTAQLELPGQAVIRLQAAGAINPTAGSTGEFVREAIFAGMNPGKKSMGVEPDAGTERNFVFNGDKRVKTKSTAAGIAVAQSAGSMPTAPFVNHRAASNTDFNPVLPAAGDGTAAQSLPERITGTAAAPAGQPLAERAVAIVTGVVEAQFTATMQRTGTVQLRLKCDGEDLSIRVELRDGKVRTNFKTDSADLRAAITREWQAVAGQSPDQMRRYLDPVFSPAPSSLSSSSGDTTAFSTRQQHSQQDQPHRQPRLFAEEAAPFTQHSLLGETFFPEPIAPRVPMVLPTSLRLSALA